MDVKKEITQEVIETFIEGHDPMERIVNLVYHYDDNFMTVVYRNEKDQKCKVNEPFYPFCWATLSACQKLCDGDKATLKALMSKYSIGVKKLSNIAITGEERHEFDNGYMFQFYAKKPMSYTQFLGFFKKANNPIYSKSKDNNALQSKTDSRQYLIVTPQEQFLISTGKRFFKGYDDYDQVLKMTFDLETTGLNTKRDRIVQIGVRINRPFFNHPDGFEEIITVTGNTEEEKDACEIWAIERMLKMIYQFKPDIITAHNGEAFDWNFIIDACERLGISLEDLSSKYFKGEGIRKEERESILKLGGEMETYHQTIVPEIIVTDSLHAVRRAQALDSNMLRADLKYVTKYSKLNKHNRVYTPGEKISEIWADEEEHYAFCEENGDWYLYDPFHEEAKVVLKKPEKDLAYFQNEEFDDILYYRKENSEAYEEYRDFLAERIDDWRIENCSGSPCEEDNFEEGILGAPISEEEYLEWEKDYSFDDWVEEVKDPRSAEERYNAYLQSIEKENAELTKFKLGKDGDKPFIMYTRNYIADGYELKSGRYIIERYLFDDLYECDKVEHRYNTPNFLICKMLPVPYKKCTTMGTAGQWKALMLAWSYENDLAVPMFGESKSFTGGLSRLLRVGFVDDVAKFDYNSLYPSIILTWAISDNTDLMQTMLHFLEHVLSQREKYKKLKKVAGKKANAIKEKLHNHEYTTEEEGKQLQLEMMKWKQEESANDKKQLPLKILGNSFFGSYGAPNVFPWGSLKCAEQTTCTGRQCLRLMISHFSNLGYAPIVGDTDGFNFKLPSKNKFRYTDEHPYISSGLSRETEKGKAYTGFKADVAEFNDMYMKDFHYSDAAVNKMGLGIDEIVDATINFSRKNYSDYFPDEPFPDDVKMVGNTIKSKKMPEYISKFLSKGIRLLLQGKGQDFLNEYYSYIEKIYNYKIPLRDIASKGKIKKSLKEYLKDVQTMTKAGRPKSRQAWYELALRNNLTVNNGDTIYYVNTGSKKGETDCKKATYKYILDEDGNEQRIGDTIHKEWLAYKKEHKNGADFVANENDYYKKFHPEVKEGFEIILNCALLPQEIVEKETDTYCSEVDESLEYNVVKYIEQFNKRITPLLVCFSKDIRGKILIDNPANRPYFTKEQCRLSSGEPNKESDQDTYQQLMTMEDKEIKFWTKYNLVPPFVEECHMGKWEDIVADYERRMKEEEESGIAAEKEFYSNCISQLTDEEISNFLDEGDIPSELERIVDIDPKSTNFISKKYGVPIGSIDDFADAAQYRKIEQETSGEE